MSERVYSVEEAEAALDDLRVRLPRIRELRQQVLRSSRRIRERVVRDGGGVEGSEHLEALRRLRADLEDLASRDIVLRDAETGLVDFPGERDGEPVFWCWRLGEEHVAHWHGPDAGFAGRRPL